MKGFKSSNEGASPNREVILQNLQVGIGAGLLYTALFLGGQQEGHHLHASSPLESAYGVVDGARVLKPSYDWITDDSYVMDSDLDGWADHDDPYPSDPTNNSRFWSGLKLELMGNQVEIPGRHYETHQYDEFESGIPYEYQFDSSWTLANSYFRDQQARISYPEYRSIYQGVNEFVTTLTVWGNYWYIDGVEVALYGLVRGQFQDSDQDGIPDESDPYPSDPSNATPGYFWQGGHYPTLNGYLYIGSRWLPHTAIDSDGDGFPDVVDPGTLGWFSDYSGYESYGAASSNGVPSWLPESDSGGISDWGDSFFDDTYSWESYDSSQDPIWFYDSDGDGLYDWEDTYPYDPTNGFSIPDENYGYGDGYVDSAWDHPYTLEDYYASTEWTQDSDGDGIPDAQDLYPYDPWNNEWQDPFMDWYWYQDIDGNGIVDWADPNPTEPQDSGLVGFYSGFFRIDGEEQYLSGYYSYEEWSDVDSDGIPDVGDPYPYDLWNNSFFWMGGTFDINQEWVTLAPTWLMQQDNVDSDEDGIPDKLDAYPLSASNSPALIQQHWEGEFAIDGNLTVLSGLYLAGTFLDYDLDGLPDWADPYPYDPLNNSGFYSGEHRVDGELILIRGYYRQNWVEDADFDGIPDAIDPYPYSASNTAEQGDFYSDFGAQEYSYTGEYRIDGVLTQFYGSSAQESFVDTDGDGLPDHVDPYPEDDLNNSYQWSGGYYAVNGTLTYLRSHWFSKDSNEAYQDQDGDGIPDALDPYPYSFENHAAPEQTWSGYFYVDGLEIYLRGSYRLWIDSDGDTIPDAQDPYPLDRTNHSTYFDVAFPQSPDSDGDGIPDSVENLLGLNPYELGDAYGDLDGDSLPNGWEYLNGLNPLDPRDAYLDWDGDNLANLEEYLQGSDPRVKNPANLENQNGDSGDQVASDTANTGSSGGPPSGGGTAGGSGTTSAGSSGSASSSGSSSSTGTTSGSGTGSSSGDSNSSQSSPESSAEPQSASEQNRPAKEDTWFLSVRKKSVTFSGISVVGKNEMRPVHEAVPQQQARLVGGPRWYIPNPNYQKPNNESSSAAKDDGFNGDADLQNLTLDEGDPRDIWDPTEFAIQSLSENPMFIAVEDDYPSDQKFLIDNTSEEFYDVYETSHEEQGELIEVWVSAQQKGLYSASNVYSGSYRREVTHTTQSSTVNWNQMNNTLDQVPFVTIEAHGVPYISAPEKRGWMGDGVLGLRSHTVSSHSKTVGNPSSGGSEVSASKEHFQFQLNRNTPVDADSPDLTISVLIVETVQKLSQAHVEPSVKSHALLQATLHEGKVAERWEVVSGTMPESVSLQGSILDVRAPNVGDKERGEIHVIPIEMIAYKRGKVGQNVEQAKPGIYGLQAVLMENADHDEANSDLRDCDTDELSAEDDDLVKIVIKMHLDPKLSSCGIALKHNGLVLDGNKTKLTEAQKIAGPSLVNFYDNQRKRLKSEDLEIQTNSGIAKGHMGKLLQNGEIEIYLEGASKFGSVPTESNSAKKAEYIGGAILQLQLQIGRESTLIDGPSMLVLRGGFFRYLQRENHPGTLETLEFRDGIGRITKDKCDLGDVVKEWAARSGVLGGGDYDEPGEKGHAPPGWSYIYERDAFNETHANYRRGTKENLKIYQGGYCRWFQDDYAPYFVEMYVYQHDVSSDRSIGKPKISDVAFDDGQTIMFKYQMNVIHGSNTYGRSAIQIHPDGKKNGTEGCIGIQNYFHCKDVYQYLNDFKYLKILVELY